MSQDEQSDQSVVPPWVPKYKPKPSWNRQDLVRQYTLRMSVEGIPKTESVAEPPVAEPPIDEPIVVEPPAGVPPADEPLADEALVNEAPVNEAPSDVPPARDESSKRELLQDPSNIEHGPLSSIQGSPAASLGVMLDAEVLPKATDTHLRNLKDLISNGSKVQYIERLVSSSTAEVSEESKTIARNPSSIQEVVRNPTEEEIEIRTPQDQVPSVAMRIENPLVSIAIKSDSVFGGAGEKNGEDHPTTSHTAPPPTLLREQNPPETLYGVESQNPSWDLYENTPETGTKGCELHLILTVLESRFKDKDAFQRARQETPGIVSTDLELFQALRDVYLHKMCGFWRRALFLKTLRGIRLLSFSPTSRPSIVPFNDFILQEIFYAYQNPSKISTKHEWIEWVFRLRQPGRRHALEFVEGWSGTRIAVAGSIPLLFSTVVGIVWSIKGSGVADGFAIAGFILTAGSLLLALLAIISAIESSERSRM